MRKLNGSYLVCQMTDQILPAVNRVTKTFVAMDVASIALVQLAPVSAEGFEVK